MRLLILGDLLGRAGRDAAIKAIPELRAQLKLDFVAVNAENASHGFGLGPDMADALFKAGADVITLGNHAWDRREIIPYIAQEKRLIRPLNYPPGTPGQGSALVTVADGRKVLVAQAMGRLFMDPLNCPFMAMDELLTRHRLGNSLHAVIHTHIPTADHQIFPRGTAYCTDLGMCGDYDSVIGMSKDAAIARFIRKMPGDRLTPAEGIATVCGAFIETGEDGLALRIEPVRLGGRLRPAMPAV